MVRGTHTRRFVRAGFAPIILAMALALAPQAARAADFFVNSFDDGSDIKPGDGKCSNGFFGGSKCTLRAAIMEASATTGGPHNIILPAGTYTLTTLKDPQAQTEPDELFGDLNVNKSLNFFSSGGAAVIRGASGWPDRIFSFVAFSGTTITITMTGLDIGNGHAQDGLPGGAIKIRSNVTMTMTNVTVRDSSVDGTGGGGISNGGSLTLNNCIIKDNSTHFDGGGISNDGSLTTTSTSITGNSAGGNGGGISNTGSMTLQRTNIDQNNANSFGGAIFNQNNTATLINVSMFSNVAAFGGGIANATQNGVAANMTVDRTTFEKNVAFTSGGAIDNASVLIVKNSTLSGNGAFGSGSGGGGIHNFGAGSATLNNVTIASNSAAAGGGILNDSGTVRFSNTILAGNSANFDTTGPDCSTGPAAPVTAAGFNLIQKTSGCLISGVNNGNISVGNIIGQDPLLGPLQANGGFAKTRALGTGSPAIDHGFGGGIVGPACETIDERQVARPQDGNGDSSAVCDIGAFEVSPVGAFDVTPDHATVQAGDVLPLTFRWTAPGSWRTLNTLRFRLAGEDGVIFDLLWNQAPNTFQTLGETGNSTRPVGIPGSHAVLEGKLAQLILDATAVQGSGPAGHDVTLTLPLALKTPSAGPEQQTYRIEVGATDIFGNSQAFAEAGTLTVTRKHD